MSNNRIRIGITLGDPNGIGPEVTIKALACKTFPASFYIYGSRTAFDKAKNFSNLRPDFEDFVNFEKPVAAVRAAVLDVLSGKLDAIVTAPLSKEGARAEIPKFTGHTEFLSELASVRKATMMFVAKDLKVSLSTTHIPLRDVSKHLCHELLSQTIEHTLIALQKWWGIDKPRIAICGLNPHASENGLFGDEEEKIIKPTIQKWISSGHEIIGPLGADTILTQPRRILYDAVISHFHDQLLPAIKLYAESEAINLTLGLPFIRTSVDHGVAYDLYGKNLANPASMMAAISLAIKLASMEKSK